MEDLACFLYLEIHKVRDKIIFEDSQIDFILNGYIGLDALREYLDIQKIPSKGAIETHPTPILKHDKILGFFDGSSQLDCFISDAIVVLIDKSNISKL